MRKDGVVRIVGRGCAELSLGAMKFCKLGSLSLTATFCIYESGAAASHSRMLPRKRVPLCVQPRLDITPSALRGVLLRKCHAIQGCKSSPLG